MTFSVAAPSNSTFSLPVTSTVTGDSSRISSTLFPAANVFCNVLPRLASATTGPNELISATVATSTPAKLIVPLLKSVYDTIIINTSNISIIVLVIAVLSPVRDLSLSSSADKLSVLSFISASLSLPQLYWRISGRPLKLSSTKLLSSPDLLLNV